MVTKRLTPSAPLLLKAGSRENAKFVEGVSAVLGSSYKVEVHSPRREHRWFNSTHQMVYQIPLGKCEMYVHTNCSRCPKYESAAGDIASITYYDDCVIRADTPVSVLSIMCAGAIRTGRSEVVRKRDRRNEQGGCCPQPGGYRRRLIAGDTTGIEYNVVHMCSQYTETHVHPAEREDEIMPQSELYVVLSPEECGIEIPDYQPKILVCPGTSGKDLRKFQLLEVGVGDILFIPPGLPHRGIDGLFGVVALPGFYEEDPFDQQLSDATKGKAPVNPNRVRPH